MLKQFDLIIIGGGPSGYVAAIHAAQNGLKVACVEKWQDLKGKNVLGGTCLNAGCIPSKALLESSAHYDDAKNKLGSHGISLDNLKIDIHQMISRKDRIIAELNTGIAQLFKANKIEWLKGSGKLLANHQVQVSNPDGVTIYQAKYIILATGSVPINIPAAPIDHQHIIDSSDILNLTTCPEHLGVIGAGVIGLEMASVWSRLGAKVTLFEASPNFLMTADETLSKEALQQFKKQNLEIRLETKVTGTTVINQQVTVNFQDNQGIQSLVVDKLLVAVGRKAYTDHLVDPSLGLLMEGNQIKVDDNCKTNLENVWAIGDVVRGPMLAHKGSEEGIYVVKQILGLTSHMNYDFIPWVIYTHPEMAWVGKTEQICKQEGIKIHIGLFPFVASGRAKAMDETSGLVKIIADARTDKILGVHIIGHNASELIHEAVVAMEFGASSEDLASIIHAHPTLAEALHEASLAVNKQAIHIINRS